MIKKGQAILSSRLARYVTLCGRKEAGAFSGGKSAENKAPAASMRPPFVGRLYLADGKNQAPSFYALFIYG